MERAEILSVVLAAVEAANLTREQHHKLEVSPAAPLFGARSRRDSLGLVSLLIDIEEAFANRGVPLVLSDERALSQRRSPFRDIPALVDYIERLLSEQVS